MFLQVVFWKWITPKMLGLVTQNSVYHWSIEGCIFQPTVIFFISCVFVSNFPSGFIGDSEPVKMFDRTANLANNQIINYKCSPNEKWLVLIGIAPGSPEVSLLRHILGQKRHQNCFHVVDS